MFYNGDLYYFLVMLPIVLRSQLCICIPADFKWLVSPTSFLSQQQKPIGSSGKMPNDIQSQQSRKNGQSKQENSMRTVPVSVHLRLSVLTEQVTNPLRRPKPSRPAESLTMTRNGRSSLNRRFTANLLLQTAPPACISTSP